MNPPVSCRLSAAVLVFNGRHTIERCLESLGFCDEIVVVDDGSTDGTWEFLQQAKVKAYQQKHVTFADQRGLARDRTQGRWLLTMDADEYVTPALAQAILSAVSRDDCDGYYIHRKNPYPEGLEGIHWTWHPRLVRKDRCRWVETDSPHAPLLTKGLHFKKLKGAFLDHERVPSVAAAIRKSLNRSIILSEQLRARKKKSGVFSLMFSCLGRLLKIYFREGGWRYGKDGFVWASLNAFEAYSKYALLLAKPTAGKSLLDGGAGSYPTGTPIAVAGPTKPDPGAAKKNGLNF